MHFDDLKQQISTVVAVPVTPFDAQGQVDLATYHSVIGRLIDGGVQAITPNGNTGEFYSLSEAECAEIVAAATAAAGSHSVVVAGVGYDSATAIAMSRKAAAAGAQAVMIHQIVHPYRSAAGWVAYHRDIAAAVPQLGIVPYVRDSQITIPMLKGLLEACPNVVGIKYAIPDPLQFAAVVKEIGRQRLTWICGIAEAWAPFFWVGGAQGFTSGLVNVHIASSLQLLSCLQSGDYDGAMKLWARLKPFEDLRGRYANGNNVSVIKEAMAQLGIGTRTVRPPISELPDYERSEVAAVLATWELATPVLA